MKSSLTAYNKTLPLCVAVLQFYEIAVIWKEGSKQNQKPAQKVVEKWKIRQTFQINMKYYYLFVRFALSAIHPSTAIHSEYCKLNFTRFGVAWANTVRDQPNESSHNTISVLWDSLKW